MNNYIGKTIDALASSYWFMPGIMAIGALLAAVFLTRLDVLQQVALLPSLDWIRYLEPEGARTLMGTIAGSMITVAGGTFSITISSIVHATSQFGPRLLINFRQDRGNQFTLGTFIATFLYCLVVLSSITGNSSPLERQTFFVPYLAVLVGVGFAVASTVVLIYFFHHVPSSIHAYHVISAIGKQLVDDIRSSYDTADQGNGISGELVAAKEIDDKVGSMRAIRSPFTGYVQLLDAEALCGIASKLDIVLVLNAKPGDFVSFGDYLAWADSDYDLEDEVVEKVCASFMYGDTRTSVQDILFQANELVEISTRALSPGINDPFTAMLCIDWLGSSFAVIAGRHSNRYQAYDGERVLRLLIPMLPASTYIFETLAKLGPYVSKDRNAVLHTQAMLGRVMVNANCTHLLSELQQEASQLCERAATHLDDVDVRRLSERNKILQQLSQNQDNNAAICRQHSWLGGSN